MLKEIVLVIFLLICSYTDLSKRLIYNRILAPVLVFGFLYSGLLNGVNGILHSLAGMLIGLLLLFFPFYFGGLGAGDVKMLAVIGAVQGPYFTFHAFLISALVGGVWAFVYLVIKKRLLATLYFIILNSYQLLKNFSPARFENNLDTIKAGETLPYGTILALGTLLTLVSR